ncbi:MAG TPA: DNA ligase D [Xanthobacteraceae bacterium]|nr:DNA ligase D [Xanthobacteraceae bacterium]
MKPPKAALGRGPKRSLEAYVAKRDFARTPEPTPEAKLKRKRAAKGAAAGLAFVVQRHAARRLHWDLRLELDGVLKSWAVTRGPSLVAGDKRLAVHTEDHPLEYLDFEGNIPKGEYGGGTMIVWDRGTWSPEGDPQAGLDKGHLAFALDGSRLKGKWHLVRMRPKRGEKTEPWLLIKSDDEFARPPGAPEITDEETSHLTGRTPGEVAAERALRKDHAARDAERGARKVALPDIGKIANARKKLLPTFVAPMLASPSEKPPRGPQWVHEIKHDGYRIQARIDGGKLQMLTRKNLDWTERFAAIATALEGLHLGSALIDGEIVVEEENGISTFNGLQADLSTGRQDRMRYHAFDLLYCDGFDLTRATLLARKSLLAQVLAALPAGSPVRFAEHLDTDGPTIFEHAGRLGLEGIISKRKDQPYRSGRSDDWVKSKCVAREEFVVLGYHPSSVAAGAVGALLLGYYEGGKLMYAGRVGTGWSGAEAQKLKQKLDEIAADKPMFGRPLPPGADIKGVRWAMPRLVADVQHRGWSADRVLRQSSFKGLREDKSADEVVLEEKPRAASAGKGAAPAHAGGAIAGVKLTHPDRLLWDEGVSKQALAEFYAEIADHILPHITGRVLSLVRAPSGAQAKSFFAKHRWAGLEHVREVDVGEKEPMIAIDDLAGLIGLVQGGTVEIHPWGSRDDDLERPDRLIFDLDPGEDVAWSDVIAAARAMRDELAAIGLESFVKTSGGKGLHVVVPVEPRVAWDDAKAFTQSIAEKMSRDHRDRYVAIMAKRARRGRIFIDYLRNGRGATAVAAFSTRARPYAPVSTPLAWEELTEGVRPDHFTVDNLRERLDFLRRDPWEGFFEVRQRIKT